MLPPIESLCEYYPKAPYGYNQPRAAMLLQQNALPNIFKERSEKPNANVRWADIGINRD